MVSLSFLVILLFKLTFRDPMLIKLHKVEIDYIVIWNCIPYFMSASFRDKTLKELAAETYPTMWLKSIRPHCYFPENSMDEQVSNVIFLKKILIIRTLIYTIRLTHLKYLRKTVWWIWHSQDIRKTGKTEESKEAPQNLMNLCKWISEQVLGEITKRQTSLKAP